MRAKAQRMYSFGAAYPRVFSLKRPRRSEPAAGSSPAMAAAATGAVAAATSKTA